MNENEDRPVMMKNPLDAVFSAPCHVAILRAMHFATVPSSGRQIARDAGVNHQACAEGLRRLENLGLVRREVLGRAHAFTLNAGHPVVDLLLQPVFKREGQLAEGKIEPIILDEMPYTEESDPSLRQVG